MATADASSPIRLEIRDDKIAVMTFDTPGKPVNTFNQANLEALEGCVGQIEKQTDLRGAILRSGKEGNFIAGADLNELMAAVGTDKNLVRTFCQRGHDLFTRISRLPFPTVAVIDGMCVGGGLECAMAFDYRIVSTNPRTELGAPEVKIGIIPGWGGTQRLPRLVGIDQALEMNCGGDSIKAEKAVDIDLAFEMVPAEELLDEGVRVINMAHETGEWKEDRERREQPMGLSDDNMMFNFNVFRGFILGKTKGQYPAPLKAIDAMERGCNLPLQDGLKEEINAIIPLIGSDISRNLIGIFFMDQAVRKDTGVDDRSVKGRPVKQVGVLGGGLMGAGIAFSHIRKDFGTILCDISDELVEAGMKRVVGPMESRIKIGRMAPQEMVASLTKLRATTDKIAMKNCDLIIEAIVEREDVKVSTFKEMEGILGENAIIASNTSTISITRMAKDLKRPDKFVGMHYFSPVDRMQLVEVIRGEKTSDETVVTVVKQAQAIGKKPIVVNDCAGFLVNRVLLPYMNEAVLLVEEGVDMEKLDKLVTKFGMPMGPVTLADMVGLDVAKFAGGVLAEAYSDRAQPAQLVPKLVEMGRLGQKSDAGFMAYESKRGKKRGKPDGVVAKLVDEIGRRQSDVPDDETILDRLFLSMLAEACRLLEENIVRKHEDVDFGLIFGIGFPPFRGGLLRWADTIGAQTAVDKLAKLAPLGKRFEAPEMLKEMAKSGKSFYK
ncbi:MAG: enoyl-CoA hydratase/isomerase family protein [Phycisphaerae bacterium]|nr:enoyl-CoA hydratase/isomerase family protein [Phycisphaerae bacterium]